MASIGLFVIILCTGFILLLIPSIGRKQPLPAVWMTVLLGIKIIVALSQSYLYFKVYPATTDAYGWFDQSRQLAFLVHTPREFYHYALPGADGWSDLFHYNFWNNLKQNILVLILYGMNTITFHNPYTDTLIYSFLTFMGWISLIRLLKGLYPHSPNWVYCLPFLSPTFLFFYSGLHADGLVFALLAYLAYKIWAWLGRPGADGPGKAHSDPPIVPESRARPSDPPTVPESHMTPLHPSASRLNLGFFLSAALLFCMKPYLILLIAPLVTGWWLVYRKGYPTGKTWWFIFILSLGLFIGSGPEQMAQKQAYLNLHEIHSPPMDPPNPLFHFWSYLAGFPQALWKGIGRPAFWETVYGKYLFCGVESICLWILVVIALLYRPKSQGSLYFFEKGWLYFCLLNILLIGYTIPLAGGLVRYRALFYPFILAFSLFPLMRNMGLRRKMPI